MANPIVRDTFAMYGVGHGSCALCGCDKRPGEAGIVDLDLAIDMEGPVEICWACAEDIIRVIGAASVSETTRMRGRIRNLEDQLIEAQREAEILAGRIKGLAEV